MRAHEPGSFRRENVIGCYIEKFYSGSSPNGQLVDSATYGHLHKTPFISTPIQTVYFYIPLRGQLQSRTPFSRSEGVRLRAELPLY